MTADTISSILSLVAVFSWFIQAGGGIERIPVNIADHDVLLNDKHAGRLTNGSYIWMQARQKALNEGGFESVKDSFERTQTIFCAILLDKMFIQKIPQFWFKLSEQINPNHAVEMILGSLQGEKDKGELYKLASSEEKYLYGSREFHSFQDVSVPFLLTHKYVHNESATLLPDTESSKEERSEMMGMIDDYKQGTEGTNDPDKRKRTAFITMETMLLLHSDQVGVKFSETWDPDVLINGKKSVDLALELIEGEECSARSATEIIMLEFFDQFNWNGLDIDAHWNPIATCEDMPNGNAMAYGKSLLKNSNLTACQVATKIIKEFQSAFSR
eukprot:CAMPEP_0197244548 /NCGR_PEP_ID=MMETSP1429-20130617/9631_1 /TAXON_ID=49237 /ORGANISM="Chaetoceros  sp., Strain UNC1202" /LENGTH=328 /DNA_ID=CAMNT_0042704923 /DNA_START=20 /DNA_END=1007 /DNA_ORIENTATION=+